MATISLNIPAISCGHCVKTIQRELGEIKGVTGVTGDPASRHVEVTWDAPATWEQIRDTLVEIGYPPEEA